MISMSMGFLQMDGDGTENAVLPLWTGNPSAQKGSLEGAPLSKAIQNASGFTGSDLRPRFKSRA